MVSTQRMTVFLHSFVERTPWWHWMSVFSVGASLIPVDAITHVSLTEAGIAIPSYSTRLVRFSPIGESTAGPIVLPVVRDVYVLHGIISCNAVVGRRQTGCASAA
jgi:hypothetical protein